MNDHVRSGRGDCRHDRRGIECIANDCLRACSFYFRGSRRTTRTSGHLVSCFYELRKEAPSQRTGSTRKKNSHDCNSNRIFEMPTREIKLLQESRSARLRPEKMRAPSTPPIAEKITIPTEAIAAVSNTAAARPSGDIQNWIDWCACAGDT